MGGRGAGTSRGVLALAVFWYARSAAAFAPRARPSAPLSSSLRATESSGSGDAVSDFCMGTNEFWSSLVIQPVRDYAAVRSKGTAGDSFFDIVTAAPENPGIPRPVWLTILASAPSGLLWYGWYKYSVEEEIYQYELATEGKVSGCGGFGTLLPFVFGILVGGPLSLVHFPGGEQLVEAAGAWILLGQLNLYRRVNEFFPDDEPLHPWWALLPPPLDVVVGLRQVHFLSEFWKKERGLPAGGDVVAEEWFPFISAPRFTLKQFAKTPSMWFWFTKDWPDLDIPILEE